ncbi:G-protein alpha subunit [Plasmodiophora brassicae]
MHCCYSGAPTSQVHPAPASGVHELAVDEQIAAERAKAEKQRLIVLLGCGESGKSTLFKTLKQIHHIAHSPHDRHVWRESIMAMLANDTMTIVRGAALPSVAAAITGSADQPLVWSDKVSAILQGASLSTLLARKPFPPEGDASSSANVDPVAPDGQLWADALDVIRLIWNDPLTAKLLEVRHLMQLGDHCEYFFGQLDTIAKPGWEPTDDDIVRARIKTTGIIEQEIEFDGNVLRMVDVGGQRSERKKWLHNDRPISQFEKASVVIFVVSLAEYDVMCYEDNNVPRWLESFRVFQDICRSPALRNARIVIFFNKMDLLEKKLAARPFSKYVTDYIGNGSADSVCRFMAAKYTNAGQACFAELGDAPGKRTLSTYFTTAISGDDVQKVFESVRDTVFTKREAAPSSSVALAD